MSNKSAFIKGMPYKEYLKDYYYKHKDHIEDKRYKHNQSHNRIYFCWQSMKDRCFNEKSKKYKNYGNRGITVCDEWKNDFTNFYNWAINNGYDESLTIDRIDVNGNYEPSNCRWSTLKEQANNKRNNVRYTYNGETHNITEWAKILNVSRDVIYTRRKRGWTMEDIFKKEIKERRK